MHPWPTHLTKRYPLPPERLSSRPWWNTGGARTNDAFVIPAREIPTSLPALYTFEYVLPDGTGTSEFEDAAAAWDKKKPLPHPGFRSGQVWALEFRQMSVVGVLDFMGPDLHDYVHRPSAIFRRPQPHATFAGRELSRSLFAFLFEDGKYEWSATVQSLNPPWSSDPIPETPPPVAYLLADPVCPWLAPWAPVEGKVTK